jgi:hypothetical protein
MRWLEVRRHSLTKKHPARGRGSHLSAEGVALARLVGGSLGPFARVVTSASPRAVETAVAMGFAVDDTVEPPSGYVPGEVDHHEQWRWSRPYRVYAGLLARGGGLAAVGEATAAPSRPSPRPCPMAPPPWSSPTATAPASPSTRAGSSASSSTGPRRHRGVDRGARSRRRGQRQARTRLAPSRVGTSRAKAAWNAA